MLFIHQDLQLHLVILVTKQTYYRANIHVLIQPVCVLFLERADLAFVLMAILPYGGGMLPLLL